MPSEFDIMLKELKKDLQAEKKAKTKEEKPESEFQQQLREVKRDLKKKKPPQKMNGSGYEYVTDPETGKMRTRAQVEWEKYNGRKVEEHQMVIFRDGNKRNFSKENLVLAYKKGVPLDALTCGNCGCRGNWNLNED